VRRDQVRRAVRTRPHSGQGEPGWRPATGYEHRGHGLSNAAFGTTTWDPDGNGPAAAVVVAGGNFEHAGATGLNLVASWDGVGWHPMGEGVNGVIQVAPRPR
jgi:hypothetical protein